MSEAIYCGFIGSSADSMHFVNSALPLLLTQYVFAILPSLCCWLDQHVFALPLLRECILLPLFYCRTFLPSLNKNKTLIKEFTGHVAALLVSYLIICHHFTGRTLFRRNDTFFTLKPPLNYEYEDSWKRI